MSVQLCAHTLPSEVGKRRLCHQGAQGLVETIDPGLLPLETGHSHYQGKKRGAPVTGLPIHTLSLRQPHPVVWAAWPWDNLVLRPWSGTFHRLRGVWGSGPCARQFPLATTTRHEGRGGWRVRSKGNLHEHAKDWPGPQCPALEPWLPQGLQLLADSLPHPCPPGTSSVLWLQTPV